MAERRQILVIAGPTASGKTAASLELARHRPIEVIIADARQVYRHLDIGTAKPTTQERAVCPHHLVDILEPTEPYSAADYARDARAALTAIPEGHLPVFVGGSGLYISAALDGLSQDVVPPEPAMREQLQHELDERGRDAMWDELHRLDPMAAERYADKNPRRVLRALEVIRITGRPFSSTWDVRKDPYPADVTYLAIDVDRAALRDRITQRCQQMWEGGLLSETRRVLEMGITPTAQSLQTVGYAEAIAVLHGRLSEDEALQQMVTNTWRYAKRQLTWFRKDERYRWVASATNADMGAAILQEISLWAKKGT